MKRNVGNAINSVIKKLLR